MLLQEQFKNFRQSENNGKVFIIMQECLDDTIVTKA